MDATNNKVPAKFNVQGFPTLVLVTAENKEKGIKANKQVVHKGDRTLEAFTAWINEHRGSTPVSAGKVDL